MPNVVSGEGVAQQVQINGDKPFFIPTDFTAGALSFTKSGEGYQALRLPFPVKEGYVGTIQNHQLEVPADGIAAGMPVVTEGKVNLTADNVTVSAGTYDAVQTGYALDAEGKSVVETQGITPFTYLFTEVFNLEDAENSISEEIRVKSEESENVICDLSGRKINSQFSTPNSQFSTLNSQLPKGLYIYNGKKILIK